MDIKSVINRQFTSLRNIFIFFQLPAGLILLFVVFLKIVFDVSTGDLLRDANAVSHRPPYVGMVSNLGILAWCATACICLFTAFLSRPKGTNVESFLLYSGILSAILMFDDLFQFHDEAFPEYLNLSEELVLLSYGLFALIIFYRHKDVILSTNYLILLTCLALFFISIVVDQFFKEIPAEKLIEDGAKFTGILTWLGYYLQISYETLKKKIIAV